MTNGALREQWRCYVCGESIGERFVLFSLNIETDRVFLAHSKCQARLDAEAVLIGVQREVAALAASEPRHPTEHFVSGQEFVQGIADEASVSCVDWSNIVERQKGLRWFAEQVRQHCAAEPRQEGTFDARAWLLNDFKLMGTPDDDEIAVAEAAYAAGQAAAPAQQWELGEILQKKIQQLEAEGICKWEYNDTRELWTRALTEEVHIFMVDHGISISGAYARKVVELILAKGKWQAAPATASLSEEQVHTILSPLLGNDHWFIREATIKLNALLRSQPAGTKGS